MMPIEQFIISRAVERVRTEPPDSWPGDLEARSLIFSGETTVAYIAELLGDQPLGEIIRGQ